MPLKKPIKFNTTFSKFVAKEIIGEGGSGTVFAAEDESGSQVAIKRLDSSKATPERLKRFKNEYRFCSQTEHKNIIQVTDHGIGEDDSPFFVMPRYTGSLRKLIDEGISQDKVITIFSQIMDGVEAAHLHDVVHRDLKPENILFRKDGDEIVVADFGIASFTAEDLYTAVETKAHARLANFQYAAPEQRSRIADVDKRADIYALGLILNEMFTGEIPQGTNYKSIGENSEPYSYVDPIVASMLNQDPNARPDTVREIRQLINAGQKTYLSHQKLSALKNEVISEREIDAPLANEPPEIVDVDWDGTTLHIELNQPIDSGWLEAFRNMGSHRAVHGKGPDAFTFTGSTARVPASADEAQRIIDHFKEWLPRVTNVYASGLKQAQIARENQERKELAKKTGFEETRNRVLTNLKI